MRAEEHAASRGRLSGTLSEYRRRAEAQGIKWPTEAELTTIRDRGKRRKPDRGVVLCREVAMLKLALAGRS